MIFQLHMMTLQDSEPGRLVVFESGVTAEPAMRPAELMHNVALRAPFPMLRHVRRVLEGDAPDLIVADYHLAGDEKGPDVVTEVCGVFERVIPAIIITADPSEELRVEAGRRGQVVLGKPVKPAALRALMTRMLAQRATVRREAS